MTDNRKKRKGLLSFLIILMISAAVVPLAIVMHTGEAEAASSVTLKVSKVSGSGDWTAKFTGGGYVGLCAKADYKVYSSNVYTLHDPDNYCRNQLMTKLAYYYGYKKEWTSGGNGCKLARAFNYVSTQKGATEAGTAYHFPKSTLQSMVDTVKNITVPSGFHVYFAIPTGNTGWQCAVIWKMEPSGHATLVKTSTDPGSTSPGLGYSFAGIQYTVYQGSKAVGTLKCNAAGKTNTITLPPGTYTVRETKTNGDYKASSKTYTVKVTSGKTSVIKASDAPVPATVKIVKKVSGEGYTGSLAFTFRLRNTANPAIVYTVTTNAQGSASVNVLKGTYVCEEIMTPAQLKEFRDETGAQRSSVLKPGDTYTFSRTNRKLKHRSLTVRKQVDDGESAEGFKFRITGELNNAGNMTSEALLETVKPDITYDTAAYNLGAWKVDEDSLKELNADAAAMKTGRRNLLITNKLTLQPQDDAADEISPDAYDGMNDSRDIEVSIEVPVTLQGAQYVYNPSDPDRSGYETSLDKQIEVAGSEEVRGDEYSVIFNSFIWYGAATEYQEIVNGKPTGRNYTLLTTDSSGNTGEITEGIQAGSFTAEELMTEEQKVRYRQPQPQTIEIKDGDAIFSYSFENKSRRTPVKLIKASRDGNIAGIEFSLTGTREFDGEEISISGVTDETGAIDFGYLYRGTYKVTETGYDIENYIFPEGWDRSSEGLPYKSIEVTGEEDKGIVIDIENIPTTTLYLTKVDKDSQLFLDNSKFDLLEGDRKTAEFRIVRDDHGNTGIDLLWTEEGSSIYAEKPDVTPVPEDYDDGGDDSSDDAVVVTPDNNEQTPQEAADEGENSPEEEPVEYNYGSLKGLKAGAEYTIRETEAPSGYGATINYTFSFEDGQKLVLENESPKIGTTALDRNTGVHMSNAEGEATIVDKVEYRNLTPGHKYLMTGRLVYKPETGDGDTSGAEDTDTVVDAAGREVNRTVEFTPDKPDGTVNVEFSFDASQLDNSRTVIFEELSDPSLDSGSDIVAVHVEPDCEGQSIYFPELKTCAAADDTMKHITNADEEVVINDVVKYSNIIAGQEYEITGTLMDKNTGKPVMSGGRPVTSTRKFTAEGSAPQGDNADGHSEDKTELVSGEISLTFRFDGTDLAGISTVVFEKLCLNGKVVGEHSDISDKDQSVELPDIGTRASRTDRTTITDRCSYTNLIPGEKYVMFGYLIDKKDNSYIEGSREQVEFTPDKSEGTVDVKFSINADELRNHTLVAYEQCYIEVPSSSSENGDEQTGLILVASHQDIDDEGQTVELADSPKTGDRSRLAVYATVMVLALVVLAILINQRRYREPSDD